MDNHQDKATQILYHYIKLLMKANGLVVDMDTYGELSDCVEHIIAAAKDAKS